MNSPCSRTKSIVAHDDGHERPPVSVIVVNWNGASDTVELVDSLLNQTYPDVRIVVVDNGSDTDDAEVLRARFGSRIKVVALERNRGCGGGYNAGAKVALENGSMGYIVTMNNDMTAAPDMITALVAAASSDSSPGIVGAKIYYSDYEGRRDVLWSAGGAFHPWAWRIHSRRGAGTIDQGQFERTEAVEWVSGATMLFRPEVFRAAGPFNERHILGYEDMEFCRRATIEGYRILFAPQAESWHKVGVSADKAHMCYPNPAAYYEFIQSAFSLPVYAWQLCLFPLLMVQWGLLFLMRSRDRRTLKGFLSQLGIFFVRR